MKEHFALLGRKAKDVVTGFEGVVTTISFDLYGCVQAVVSPGVNEKQDLIDGRWFDTKRLVPLSVEPVMAVPSFEVVPGGAEKPAPPSHPAR